MFDILLFKKIPMRLMSLKCNEQDGEECMSAEVSLGVRVILGEDIL